MGLGDVMDTGERNRNLPGGLGETEVGALLGNPQRDGAEEVELGPCPHPAPTSQGPYCAPHPLSLLVQAAALAAALALGPLPAFLPSVSGLEGGYASTDSLTHPAHVHQTHSEQAVYGHGPKPGLPQGVGWVGGDGEQTPETQLS